MQTYYYNKGSSGAILIDLTEVTSIRTVGGLIQIQRKGVSGWETLDLDSVHHSAFVDMWRRVRTPTTTLKSNDS